MNVVTIADDGNYDTVSEHWSLWRRFILNCSVPVICSQRRVSRWGMI